MAFLYRVEKLWEILPNKLMICMYNSQIVDDNWCTSNCTDIIRNTCGPVLFCKKKGFVHTGLARLVTERFGYLHITPQPTKRKRKRKKKSSSIGSVVRLSAKERGAALAPKGKDKKQSDQGLVAKMLGFSPRMDHLPCF